jgi:3-(3-hydroxy-phenyl)propionate hydroxylase
LSNDRILIAGAGPVGLVAAAHLARAGVPVTVFEEGADLSTESRASTFHPPTLDMLDALGAAAPLIAQGLKAPTFQYRTKKHGLLAEFNFAAITDATKHPYRLQSEQSKLTRILFEQMRGHPNFEMKFNSRVAGVSQDDAGVEVTLEGGSPQRGRYLIGADGASSTVRRSLGVEFEGFTYPELFLIASTAFKFENTLTDIAYVNYIADPSEWLVLLRVPELWRVLVPAPENASKEEMLSEPYLQAVLNRVVPRAEPYKIAHRSLYPVHQRVAKNFRHGRVVLAGDAAHINNPLGGMGMNGGIQDAFNVADKFKAIFAGADDDLLDRYDRQRRTVAVEAVQQQTHRNQQVISERDPATRQKALDAMRRTAADKVTAREYMLRSSMIASLRRAAEIA